LVLPAHLAGVGRAHRLGLRLTQNSVLVLLDGSVYDDQLADGLYHALKVKQTPAVLLLVRRRFAKPAAATVGRCNAPSGCPSN
jgi:hypothetical protein